MKSDIVSAKRVLIDTSIWIEYFKIMPHHKLVERVDELLTLEMACISDVVIAELLQGAKSQNEISTIRELSETLALVSQSQETWQGAGMLSHMLKKKGRSIHLVDCYIAVIAQENQCQILTMDKHFEIITQYYPVKLDTSLMVSE